MERECVDLPFGGYLRFAVTYSIFKKPFFGANYGKMIFNILGVTVISLYSLNILKRRFPKLNATLGKSHF